MAVPTSLICISCVVGANDKYTCPSRHSLPPCSPLALPCLCSIERTAYVSENVYSHVFRLLNEYKWVQGPLTQSL